MTKNPEEEPYIFLMILKILVVILNLGNDKYDINIVTKIFEKNVDKALKKKDLNIKQYIAMKKQ